MEFLYHHRTNGRGGEGVHISGMVRGLRAIGHSVTVVGPPGTNPLAAAGSAPVDKGGSGLRGIQNLWKLISRYAPQLLFEILEIVYNVYAAWVVGARLHRRPRTVLYERYAFFLCSGVLAARRRHCPVLLEVNEVVGIERARGQVLVRLAKRLERAAFGRADAVLAVSSFLRDEIVRRGASPRAVHVVPNAVDAEVLALRGSGSLVRDELGLAGTTVAGFIGWFDQWDRLELLVESVGRLRSRCPDLRLLLVGDGPVRGGIEDRVRGLGLEGIVLTLGAVTRDRAPRYIDAMDIGVIPDSNPFGSPIALFEMMALAKPVIVPDLMPFHDVVQDGVTGLIVKGGSLRSLDHALERLALQPELRISLGKRARETILSEHTWEANARRVSEIAEALAPRRGAGR